MVKPTWEDRDLPVLLAAVELIEESDSGHTSADNIEYRTGFDGRTVQAALRALQGAEPKFFLSYSGSSSGISAVGSPTERARRASGLWPSAEALTDRVVTALDHAAEEAESEEQRGKLRQLASAVGGVGRGVFVEVLAKVAQKQLGLE